MFGRLKELFVVETDIADDAGGSGEGFDDVQLAAAALMIETASLDDHFGEDERAEIKRLVRAEFALDSAVADRLIAAAELAAGDATHYQRFTQTLKDAYDDAERTRMMEMLWRVAYADGQVHDLEASMMRRIGGLLYISDRDNGAARKRALAGRDDPLTAD